MRWSDKSDDNLDAVLHGEERPALGAALTELREHRTEPSEALRNRVRAIAADAEERAWTPERKFPLLRRYRLSFAHVAIVLVAFAGLTAAMTGIKALGDGDEPSQLIGGPMASSDQVERARKTEDSAGDEGSSGAALRSAAPPPAPPPPPGAADGAGSVAPKAKAAMTPIPSTNRAQDYSARIKLHVADHDELSEAAQSAIRSTRQLGGYVTYVDYGTSGSKDGQAALAVRIPVNRVQTAVARFSELGTILEQQTEIVDLQSRIDRITRDIQRRRDRIAKLEAELKDPNLTDAERNRLEARLVQAKRGLANATGDRAGVLRQSRFAKLDLAFTTEKRSEPAAPPSELRKTLEDAIGILAAELAIGLFVLIVAAPILFALWLAWLGLRLTRRLSGERLLEAS